MGRWMIRMVIIFLLIPVLTGCRIVDVSEGEVKEVEYTVLGNEDLPEEVRKLLEEQGQEPFALAYESGGFLYLMKGYGRQNSSANMRLLEFNQPKNK